MSVLLQEAVNISIAWEQARSNENIRHNISTMSEIMSTYLKNNYGVPESNIICIYK